VENEKASYKLNESEEKIVHESLRTMKKKLKKTILCRKCGEQIKFALEEGRSIPFDMDDVPHWQTCSYSGFTQKKAALDIAKKLGILFLLKNGTDLEAEAGFTKKEVQILHAILEKIFKQGNEDSEESKGQEEDLKILDENAKILDEHVIPVTPGSVLDDPMPFAVQACDPIGDPDEERAPSEELIKQLDENVDQILGTKT
jgi:hypothetical protein